MAPGRGRGRGGRAGRSALGSALPALSPAAAAALSRRARAVGTSDETSDWDLGLYYRGHADFTMLARYDEVHSPGSWGRIMNGGAWLSLAVESAGLESRQVRFERIPASPADLVGWVGSCRAALATVQEADCRRSR